jgi:hypothetical protein
MSMEWVSAYGVHELAFVGAANRALRGVFGPCPRCNGALRSYFHVFQSQTGKGTLWLWCSTCGMHTTLTRVKPALRFPDPFAGLARREFGVLEADGEERFFDRLERMWSDGILRPPRSARDQASR